MLGFTVPRLDSMRWAGTARAAQDLPYALQAHGRCDFAWRPGATEDRLRSSHRVGGMGFSSRATGPGHLGAADHDQRHGAWRADDKSTLESPEDVPAKGQLPSHPRAAQQTRTRD